MAHDTPVVFIVDDDVSVREAVEGLVRTEGLQPHTFASAEEFLLRPRLTCPSCLILDVKLPDLNGLELQERIAHDHVAMPIIFISGYGDVSMTAQAMKAGAVDFLTKPLSADETLSAIHHAIERSRMTLADEANARVIAAGRLDRDAVNDRAAHMVRLQQVTLLRAHAYGAERAARETAETLAQTRADVLGVVAHDLRNPLNLIEWTTDTLLNCDELPSAERDKMLDIMRRAASRMNRLIGDLLDATRLQAGRLSLDLHDVDVRRVVREAQETLAPLAAESRVELRFQPPDSACFVRADEGRLLQVIGNLVTNALKFTHAGGRVTISVHPAGAEVVFRVADDGPGIPEADQAHLFDAFWQARSGDRRGLGLGLSITKDIVTALRGRIWMESTAGVGTTFSFALPSPDGR